MTSSDMTSVAAGAPIVATVEQAVGGDELAFARIVDAYHLDLVRVAYVICGDRAMAEDAAQAAWWIAWRRLATLRDPRRIRGWLVAVAANEARKLRKHEHRAAVVEIRVRDEVERTPDREADDPAGFINDVDLVDALNRLAPHDRSLIALRYAADLDSAELASALGISASGVRSRLQRLLDRLRKDLGDD